MEKIPSQFMEKIPSQKRESGASRIVGVDSEDEKEILEFFKDQFNRDEKVPLDKEHQPELDEAIPLVNKHLREFLDHYGVEYIDIPSKNIHIVDKSKLTPEQLETTEKSNTAGFYLAGEQQIVILKEYGEGKKLDFFQTLVHEMIHLNSFLSFQKLKPEEADKKYKIAIKLKDGTEKTLSLGIRRVGFRIKSPKGITYFYNIDEPVITELMMRFDRKYFSQIPQLAEEYQRRQRTMESISQASGDRDRLNELKNEIANITTERLQDGRYRSVVKDYSWDEERKELDALIDELYNKNKTEFSNREEVFNIFAKATMAGRLLPVARLIEKTLGKGSFRELGEKTSKKE